MAPGLRYFEAGLWEIFRGPGGGGVPSPAELSRRYVELLSDNLGQPGFRELIVSTLDLETRSDLIFAVMAEQRRASFFHRTQPASKARGGSISPALRGPERSGDLIDLAGVGRSQALDALAGALSVPVLCDPHPIAFSPESYWKGETHRTCDRPAAVERLLHELTIAGVEQVIVISAASDRSAPHRLTRPLSTLEARMAEHLSATEASAVRDAVAIMSPRFQKMYVVQPAHNPLGPFDFDGVYDDRSDRFQTVEELIDRGYEDTYRQFIDPEG